MMFSEDEQEIIIHKFLNMISRKETAEHLKDKCSKCQECKFTKQNLELYKLDLPNEVVKTYAQWIITHAIDVITLALSLKK